MPVLGVLFFLLTSCTTIHYESSGQVPVVVGLKDGHDQIREINGEKSFFLWGLIPSKHFVLLDQEVHDMGYISGANLHIEEFQTFGNFVTSVLSLGMYIPKNYRITVHGMNPANE